MTIKYVDYEGSAGNADGSSFANRANQISNISGLTGGDEIRLKKSPNATLVDSGARVIRRPMWTGWNPSNVTVTKSTTEGETSLNKWTHGLLTGDWVQLEDSTTASDLLDGLWKVTRVDANNFKLQGYTAPDTGSTNVKLNFIGSRIIELSSAVTQNIASTGPRTATWTAETNVTTALKHTLSAWTTSTDYMLPPGSDEIDISGSFGTGKAAYFATGTLDLSGYQQVSFYIQLVSGSTSNGLSLRLCTDTAGATSVHQADIPMNKVYQTNRWTPITVDLGTNLNSSIKSIAVYVDTDNGAQKIRLSNIIACKAASSDDSLTLNSVVGLKTTADPLWFSPAYIDGTVIVIGCGTAGENLLSYYGQATARFSADNASANLYKRQPIEHHSFGSDYAQLDSINGDGTSSDYLTISGGWNTTDMSTTDSDSETFIDCVGAGGKCLVANNDDNINLKDISYIRGRYGLQVEYCDRFSLDNCHFINQSYRPFETNQSEFSKINAYFVNGYQQSNLNYCTQHSSASASDFNIWCLNGSANNTFKFNYSGSFNINYMNTENSKMGLYINQSGGCTITTLDTGNSCGSFGMNVVGIKVYGASNGVTITTLNCGQAELPLYNDGATEFSIGTLNCTHYEDGIYGDTVQYSLYATNSSSTFINGGSVTKQLYVDSSTAYTYNLEITDSTEVGLQGSGKVYAKNHDNVSGADKNFFINATIEPETTIRNTASGVSWKASITNASTYTSAGPLTITLGKTVCAANAQVTVTLKVYRSSTSIFGGIRIPANIPLGLSSAGVTYGTGSAGAWETVTHTFTPTAAGAVSVQAAFYATNASSSVYIDDISITQA